MTAIPDVRFFAADPSSEAFLAALRADLAKAAWVRFSVCYFNERGFEALEDALVRPMKHPLSQGLATLTCACGYTGLKALWSACGQPRGRLKAFVPLQTPGRRDEDAQLLHSKLVVLVQPGRGPADPDRVVVYTGSHNWTGAGLRAGGPRYNVEASVRLETDWHPRWLELVHDPSVPDGNHPVVDALRQLARCFGWASCTDLGDGRARDEFEAWLRDQCKEGATSPGSTPFLVASAVLAGQVDGRSAQSGRALPPSPTARIPQRGDLLFVQHYQVAGRDPETFDSSLAWAVLLWPDPTALEHAEPPTLLLCRARNLGQADAGSPNLRRVPWLMYDPGHNSAGSRNPRGQAKSDPVHVTVPGDHLPTGRALDVEVWRLAPVSPGTTTDELNHGAPARTALVEVVAVRTPSLGASVQQGQQWEGTELPFHGGRQRRARRGYVVFDPDGRPSPARARAMREEQHTLFRLSVPDDAGPTAEEDLLFHDVFPCVAPINEVLFTRRERPIRDIFERQRERGVRFEVTVDPDRARASGNRIRRMERLLAPGMPHVVRSLALDGFELERLGWTP